MQCECATLSSVAWPALQYFSTLSHKRHDFRGKIFIEHKCGFRFDLQLSSEKILIQRRTEQDVIVNAYWSSCKVPFIVVSFNKTWIFPTLKKIIIKEYKISWQSVKWEPSCSLRTDGQMDANEANSQFPPFCESAHKIVSTTINLSHKIVYKINPHWSIM
jgi:hypothetical protein